MTEKDRLRQALLDLRLDLSNLRGVGIYEKQGLTSLVSEIYNDVTFGESNAIILWRSFDSLRDYLNKYRDHLSEDVLERVDEQSLQFCRKNL